MERREEYRLGAKRLAGINPVTYGQQECAPRFSVDVLRPYWLLHYVVSGRGRYETGNVSYAVGPSQIFVVRPHQPHRYTADEREPWHYIWIAFESDVQMPKLLSTDVFTAPAASKLFSDCLAAAQMEAGKEEYLAGKVFELLSLFLRMECGKAVQLNPYISRAKQYIEENYMRGIKVADIAKAMNLDRSYFSTLFKKETGMSPQEYLAAFRLELAAEQLVRAGGTVAAAAYHAGYNDIVNFSRTFKKHFGIAPSKYRELILQNEETFRSMP